MANADRAANGAPALTEDTLLDRSAQMKADDMAAKGYFAHVSPDGTTPWHWFEAVNYYYYDAGENLAQGYSDEESLNTAWMNSPTHRANIVNPVYQRVGIGVAVGTYEGRTVIFVAEDFANPYIAPVIAKAPAQPTVAKAVTPVKQTVAPVKKKTAVVSKKKLALKRTAKKKKSAIAALPKRPQLAIK